MFSVCPVKSVCLGFSSLFMVCAFAMELVVSLPWCGFSSHATVAWLQVVFYIWPIDALPTLCYVFGVRDEAI